MATTGSVSALDFEGEDGGARINAALRAVAGVAIVARRVVVPAEGPDPDGTWSIAASIRIPSGTTLVLDNARLVLADGAGCPMMVNAEPEHGDSDIAVVGVGVAHLDGNAKNQKRTRRGRDVEIWMERNGLPLSRSTRDAIGGLSVEEFENRHAIPTIEWADDLVGPCGMQFTNVSRLTIDNLDIGPTNMFGIHVGACSDVAIERIRFRQDGSQPNQDGVGVFGPAERIRISSISGTCGDDAVGIHAYHPSIGGGNIDGVTVSDVVVRNVWNCGVLRTEGTARITNVVASNLVLLDGEGNSEGHSAIKLGTTRRSWLTEFMVAPGHEPLSDAVHENIQIHGVTVKDWLGPVVAVYQPVRNLVITGVTGTHTGPLLLNFESEIDGLAFSHARTRMIPLPDGQPFVGGMLRYCMSETGLPQSVTEGERAAVILDGDHTRGVALVDVNVELVPDARRQAEQAGAKTIGIIDRTANSDGTRPTLIAVDFAGFDALD